MKEALAEKDAALSASQSDNAALQLKASTTKQHCIFFDEPWIVETTYHRLSGTVPSDREGHYFLALQGMPHLSYHGYNGVVSNCSFLIPWRLVPEVQASLACMDPAGVCCGNQSSGSSSEHAAGKLVLVGGQGQRECTSKEVCHLDLQSMTWELPSSARMHWNTVQASCAIMSSSKVCTGHPSWACRQCDAPYAAAAMAR